jgi:hypothetical protein
MKELYERSGPDLTQHFLDATLGRHARYILTKWIPNG